MQDRNIETQQEINETIGDAMSSEQSSAEGWADATSGGEYPPENSLDLFSNVLINTDANSENYPELRSYVATGYMENKELEAIRRMHSVLSNGDHILDTIKQNLDENASNLKLDKVEKLLLRKLFFLAYSSKSKNGFTVLELNSQHNYHHENLYQRQEMGEKEGALSGIKDKLGAAADKGLNSDQRIMPESRRSDEIW